MDDLMYWKFEEKLIPFVLIFVLTFASHITCQRNDMEIVKGHAVSVTPEDKQTIVGNDSCVPISRHRILIHLPQLRLTFNFELHGGLSWTDRVLQADLVRGCI